jgi:hypothetical protein
MASSVPSLREYQKREAGRQSAGAHSSNYEEQRTIMTRKVKGQRIAGPFVAVLKDTLASPAWRAMSHGARSLYICLKCRYHSKQHNNGRLYVSQRQAAKEIGSGYEEIARWFRELQHYGFIVMMTPGHLGLDGKGKAPHWRLTELGYLHEAPTREFRRWDGVKFADQRRQCKKQNPVTGTRNGVLRDSVAVVLRDSVALTGTTVTESRNIPAESVLRDSVTSLVNHWGGVEVGVLPSSPPARPPAGSPSRLTASTPVPPASPATASPPPATAASTAPSRPPVRVQLLRKPTAVHLHGAAATKPTRRRRSPDACDAVQSNRGARV